MLFKLVDRQDPLSFHSWSVCRSTLGGHLDRNVTMSCRRHIGRVSVVPPIVSVDYRPTLSSVAGEVGRVSAESDSRVSVECWSSIGRDIDRHSRSSVDRVSAERSVEYLLLCLVLKYKQ